MDRQQAHTNGQESIWATLERGYHGVYHHMIPKRLDRCAGEDSGRHNVRSHDTIGQMAEMMRAIAGQRMRCRDLIAAGPAYPNLETWPLPQRCRSAFVSAWPIRRRSA